MTCFYNYVSQVGFWLIPSTISKELLFGLREDKPNFDFCIRPWVQTAARFLRASRSLHKILREKHFDDFWQKSCRISCFWRYMCALVQVKFNLWSVHEIHHFSYSVWHLRPPPLPAPSLFQQGEEGGWARSRNANIIRIIEIFLQCVSYI